jgi:cap1 methyltransferase
MDPTISICLIQDSFLSRSEPELDPISKLSPYRNSPTTNQLRFPVADLRSVPISGYQPKDEFVNPELHSRLESVKRNFSKFSSAEFRAARRQTNPFENIPPSIFYIPEEGQDRAGLKLANIDAIFRITGANGGYWAKQTLGNFLFCDLAGAPGAWTQYIQYRRPEAIGFGISLNRPGAIQWSPNRIDLARFNITDGSGDLYTEVEPFSTRVLRTIPSGVDLVVADGGFDVEGSEEKQEILTSRLILAEVLTALKTLKVGGDFVCKLYETVTPILLELLYIIAISFHSITLFKPMSSRPANSEKYLIAQGRLDNLLEPISILESAYRLYKDDNLIINLIRDSEIPPEFTEWLIGRNNFFTQLTLNSATDLLSYLEGETVKIRQYNLYRAIAIWNLPDHPVPLGQTYRRKERKERKARK